MGSANFTYTESGGINLFAITSGASQSGHALMTIGGPATGNAATVYMHKDPNASGYSVYDDSGSLVSLFPAYDAFMFNVTGTLSSSRLLYHAHIDASNTTATVGQLGGFSSGCHATNSDCFQALSTGSNSYVMRALAQGALGWYQEDGLTGTPKPTVGFHIGHWSTGNVFEIYQQYGTMTGDIFYINTSNAGSGVLTGNIINYNVNGTPKVLLDAGGNFSNAGVNGSIIASVASAGTITVTSGMTIVSGTAAIATINLPGIWSAGVGGCVQLSASGAWTTTTAGNISNIILAVANTTYLACWNGTKWYIK